MMPRRPRIYTLRYFVPHGGRLRSFIEPIASASLPAFVRGTVTVTTPLPAAQLPLTRRHAHPLPRFLFLCLLRK